MKQCINCGPQGKIKLVILDYRYRVMCYKCGIGSIGAMNKEDAVKKWNERRLRF